MIKVLIADDQELIRESLRVVLGSKPDLEITDVVDNGRNVIRSIRENKPDIVLMDIRMPEMDGVTCTRIIKENYPDVKIIMLTTFDDDEYIFQALRDGASGYLLKGISVDELVSAIHKVSSGSAMINADIASKVIQQFSRMAKANLTIQVDKKMVEEINSNEWRVIQQVGRGLSNKEIAGKLALPEGTVRNYLSNILRKLDLRDRTQLAIWAVQSGVVTEYRDDEV